MIIFQWNEDKNQTLKKERGVSFEEILDSKFIGAEKHPTRKNQIVLKFEYKNISGLYPVLLKRNIYS
jgi:hypothetical protein